mmetsp:Transcript_22346/g.70007  ORF Transcript_22346/g.70007 Transcript_22346/m.70007 type:complete len:96 (+) Transcript_22346:637-924(+)
MPPAALIDDDDDDDNTRERRSARRSVDRPSCSCAAADPPSRRAARERLPHCFPPKRICAERLRCACVSHGWDPVRASLGVFNERPNLATSNGMSP